MWKLPNIDGPDFSDMNISEMLYEVGVLQIFTFFSSDRLFLAYTSCESDDGEDVRLLVVPTSKSEVEKLKTGQCSIDKILDKDFIWAIDKVFDGSLKSVVLLPNGLKDVPLEFKPIDGTMLWSDLQEQIDINVVVDAEKTQAIKRDIKSTTESLSKQISKIAASYYSSNAFCLEVNLFGQEEEVINAYQEKQNIQEKIWQNKRLFLGHDSVVISTDTSDKYNLSKEFSEYRGRH